MPIDAYLKKQTNSVSQDSETRGEYKRANHPCLLAQTLRDYFPLKYSKENEKKGREGGTENGREEGNKEKLVCGVSLWTGMAGLL